MLRNLGVVNVKKFKAPFCLDKFCLRLQLSLVLKRLGNPLILRKFSMDPTGYIVN